jgi:hypothetical protein|tara:strand:- start:408 stop:524 length:117 start_codon:yes stop_codon:yes gene_type:complete
MSKEITPVNRAEEKPFFDWSVVYNYDEQKRHDHGMFSQ